MIVYVLRSIPYPRRSYGGLTGDLPERLAAPNAGKSRHTSRFKPWQVVVAVHFNDIDLATRFEKYLKSGSGHAFLKAHFWPDVAGPQF